MIEYSVISVLIGTLLAFISGTNLTWPSPEIPYLNSTDTGPFNGTLTDDEASWIVGLVMLGAGLSPFVFGYLTDKIGRKYTILTVSVFFAASSVLIAFSKTVAELYVARFISGMCVGGTSTVLPTYIGEMSLDEHRAVLGSTMNVIQCFGLLFTYVTGSYIENVMAFNLLLGGLAGLFFVLFFILGSESPHWYILKNSHDLGTQALLKIRNARNGAIEKELDYIKSVTESEEKRGIFDIFKSKANTKALVIGCGLVFFQQASGINAILFFAQVIFEKAGASLKPMYCSMVIGGVQFGTTFITPLVCNRFGRKVLLIFSGIGMFLSEGLLGIYSVVDERDHDKVSSIHFLPIVFLVFYIITYNVGFGPVPWVIISEIFPTNIRSSATALATSVCCMTSFFIANWFSQITKAVGQGECFLGFAIASLVGVAFTQFYVFETKGKSLVQIQKDLSK